MDYKDTLLMGKTNFEMRGNLNMKEPPLIEQWKNEKIYEEMNLNRKEAIQFVLHDGPPYANGDIHCGHMLNRILKDIVVRYKNMSGCNTPFIFGWDTHGLPIENQVTKSGVNRKTTPIVDFRKKCEEYALKQVDRQKEEIRRLGLIGDFDNPYITLKKEYEAKQIENFRDMALNGLIYKGLKPVYWSPSSESALAEAEIEYADVLSHSIYVAFKVRNGKGVVDNDARLVIWTTTPWTMPANLAISAHPDFVYGEYSTAKGKLVFLQEFKDRLIQELELGEVVLLKTFKGSDLDGIVCVHPFYDRDSLVLNGTHVTNDAGTGLVHTAPGHGAEDYQVCLKYKIQPYCPVDEKGFLTPDCGDRLAGLFYEDANEVVLQILTENNALLKHSTFTHSYPHDWRTHKPVIFRATDQWFCSIDPIRNKLLEAIHEVKWYPSWGETRMVNMIKDRGDWCISRQRAWGVPIPIIYNEDGSPILEKEVFDHIVNLVRENGSNVWYEKDPKDLLPNGYRNEYSPNGKFTKEKDIMDVWFDSGSSFTGTLLERGIKFPADLYLEGSDQYRGWFNSSLIVSVATTGRAPYRNVVSHGWVLDEHGEQMHKSKGNGVDPIKIANQYGADILRLWVATVDYQQDVRIGDNLIKQVADQYRKLRNTLKFISWNLYDFDPDKDSVSDFSRLSEYMYRRTCYIINNCIEAYEEYNFPGVVNTLLQFCSSDLSSLYLDINKDTLYCEAKDSHKRREVQTVMYRIINKLMVVLNPILPFTMDELNKNLPGKRANNVQLMDFPVMRPVRDEKVIANASKNIKVRIAVMKALEEARTAGIIGSSLEAHVFLEKRANENLEHIKTDYVSKLLVVSEVTVVDELSDGKDYDGYKIKVIHHQGHFCERCWCYEDDAVLQEDGTYLCKRCAEVMEGLKNAK